MIWLTYGFSMRKNPPDRSSGFLVAFKGQGYQAATAWAEPRRASIE
ncbi:hypothetical protein J2X08_001450 [Rhizobium rosettiformans]|nr:hypothetical protein [Rhizobium rosettiformans]MDR7063965.1 hypothetical protein [Rhizobium rosettiformans]